jgi:hypothetical protein
MPDGATYDPRRWRRWRGQEFKVNLGYGLRKEKKKAGCLWPRRVSKNIGCC